MCLLTIIAAIVGFRWGWEREKAQLSTGRNPDSNLNVLSKAVPRFAGRSVGASRLVILANDYAILFECFAIVSPIELIQLLLLLPFLLRSLENRQTEDYVRTANNGADGGFVCHSVLRFCLFYVWNMMRLNRFTIPPHICLVLDWKCLFAMIGMNVWTD